MGQVLSSAGYEFVNQPLQAAGGKFTFWKQFTEEKPMLQGLYSYVEFQHLVYVSSEWAPNAASRFSIILTRSDSEQAQLASEDPDYLRCSLSELVVQVFGVSVLPSANHWWHYRDQDELATTLVEAGHLLVGYGLPWLEDDLKPSTARLS